MSKNLHHGTSGAVSKMENPAGFALSGAETVAASAPEAAIPPMPAGVSNIYLFEIFNTISWTVVLSTPMLLFLKHLNANATLLSLASALSPVLNVLQLPAAHL